VFSDGSDWKAAPGGARVCDACGAEPATVHVLRLDGEGMNHSHLCQECAEGEAGQVEGAALVVAMPSAGTIGATPGRVGGRSIDENGDSFSPLCVVCGTTLNDFRESGLFGCAACHELFRGHVGEVDESSVEGAEYQGKIPLRMPGDKTERREVVRLQRMLRELIDTERFEEAAGVRDRLTDIEAGFSNRRVDG